MSLNVYGIRTRVFGTRTLGKGRRGYLQLSEVPRFRTDSSFFSSLFWQPEAHQLLVPHALGTGTSPRGIKEDKVFSRTVNSESSSYWVFFHVSHHTLKYMFQLLLNPCGRLQATICEGPTLTRYPQMGMRAGVRWHGSGPSQSALWEGTATRPPHRVASAQVPSELGQQSAQRGSHSLASAPCWAPGPFLSSSLTSWLPPAPGGIITPVPPPHASPLP